MSEAVTNFVMEKCYFRQTHPEHGALDLSSPDFSNIVIEGCYFYDADWDWRFQRIALGYGWKGRAR